MYNFKMKYVLFIFIKSKVPKIHISLDIRELSWTKGSLGFKKVKNHCKIKIFEEDRKGISKN